VGDYQEKAWKVYENMKVFILITSTMARLSQEGDPITWNKEFQNLTLTERSEFCSELPLFPLCERTIPLRGSIFSKNMEFASVGSYGCWCDISNDLKANSKGDPVNELDTYCKQLHHNYNCVHMEYQCNPRSLDRQLGEYSIPIMIFISTYSLETLCAWGNPDNPCGEATCIVEGHFLRNAFAPFFRGDSYWQEMWHDKSYRHKEIGGKFDTETQCVSTKNTDGMRLNYNNESLAKLKGDLKIIDADPSDRTYLHHKHHQKQCCGEYPNKHEFFVDRKMCCNGRVERKGSC